MCVRKFLSTFDSVVKVIFQSLPPIPRVLSFLEKKDDLKLPKFASALGVPMGAMRACFRFCLHQVVHVFV